MTFPFAAESSSSTSRDWRACLVASDTTLAQWPDAARMPLPGVLRWQRVRGGLDEALAHLHTQPTDLLIAEVASPSEAQWQQLTQTLRCHPSVRMVLLSGPGATLSVRQALRSGVRDVLEVPLEPTALDQVCQEQLQQLRALSTPEGPDARILAVVGAKGGCGATFLTTSLAHAISLRQAAVGVVDMKGEAGDAAWYLSDSPPTTGLRELSQQLHRLDAALLEASLMDCGPRLQVLAGGGNGGEGDRPSAQAMARVLSLMRDRCTTTVVDAPTTWDGATQETLMQAHSVHLVISPHMADLRAAQHWLQAAQSMPELRAKVSLVVNHVHAYSPIGIDSICQALQFEQAREIAHSKRAVTDATHYGVPVVSHSRSDPAARALWQWAQEWVGQPRARRWWPWPRGQHLQGLRAQPA